MPTNIIWVPVPPPSSPNFKPDSLHAIKLPICPILEQTQEYAGLNTFPMAGLFCASYIAHKLSDQYCDIIGISHLNAITATLHGRCGHYIFVMFVLFFPRLISAVTDWMSTILLHMAWP